MLMILIMILICFPEWMDTNTVVLTLLKLWIHLNLKHKILYSLTLFFIYFSSKLPEKSKVKYDEEYDIF